MQLILGNTYTPLESSAEKSGHRNCENAFVFMWRRWKIFEIRCALKNLCRQLNKESDFFKSWKFFSQNLHFSLVLSVPWTPLREHWGFIIKIMWFFLSMICNTDQYFWCYNSRIKLEIQWNIDSNAQRKRKLRVVLLRRSFIFILRCVITQYLSYFNTSFYWWTLSFSIVSENTWLTTIPIKFTIIIMLTTIF